MAAAAEGQNNMFTSHRAPSPLWALAAFRCLSFGRPRVPSPKLRTITILRGVMIEIWLNKIGPAYSVVHPQIPQVPNASRDFLLCASIRFSGHTAIIIAP